jgi:hypothetical protein
LTLWVEHACQSVAGTVPVSEELGDRAVRTFQTREQFWTVLVTCPRGAGRAREIAGQAAALLGQDQSLDTVVEAVLGSLRPGEYAPLAILHVAGGERAHLVECDAPPLFLVRRGRLVLLPVVEDDLRGRLIRRCEFTLQEGDRLAVVSTAYIRAKGWDRQWGWRDIALSIRRLTDTGCDAGQLLGALVRMYQRLAQGEPVPAVTVMAMHVRPLRSATVWSGPPADPADDTPAVRLLMAEPGVRIICGDTTAAIGARVLGQSLEQEPRPAEGWAEVPPTSRLAGIDLVTEGVVTLRKARERLSQAQCPADLPRSSDGATRLARLLLETDVVHFLVGSAVNPAQKNGALSWRQEVIEQLIADLQARGKIVVVEDVG